MQFFLEVLLTSWIDPFLWFKSMSTLGSRKGKKKSILVFLIYCCLIDVKAILEKYRECNIMIECLMILVLLYVVWATWFLFEGTVHEKAIYIFMFYCILIITELSVIGAGALFYPKSIDGVLSNRSSGLLCGCLVKILQGLLCYCFFGSKKAMKFFYQNRERLLLILMSYIMLGNLYLKGIMYKENLNRILLLETLFLFWYIISSFFSLKGKNKDIGRLKQKVESSLCTRRQISDIDQLRHDFSANMFLMKNLWYYKEYNKLEHFVDTLCPNVAKAELMFEHPNFPIRIVVSNLMKIAASDGIPLYVQMEVKEFGMTDEEICMVLHNLVLHCLKLASFVSVCEAYVRLETLYNDIGYGIRCQSTCKKEEKKKSDSRMQIDGRDIGMEIIEQIISKYDGIVEWKTEKSETKHSYERKVYIQIPCK